MGVRERRQTAIAAAATAVCPGFWCFSPSRFSPVPSGLRGIARCLSMQTIKTAGGGCDGQGERP